MVGSKGKKEVKQKEIPKGKVIAQGGDPERYYSEYPAWTFANSDQEMWPFCKDQVGDAIWSEIIPRLKALESQTWGEILVRDKKQNHSLDLNELNKRAQDRLTSRYIEAESLISLRLSGSHRFYFFIALFISL